MFLAQLLSAELVCVFASRAYSSAETCSREDNCLGGRQLGLSTGFSSLSLLVPELIQLLLHIFLTFPFQSTVETLNLSAALCAALAFIACGGKQAAQYCLRLQMEVAEPGLDFGAASQANG